MGVMLIEELIADAMSRQEWPSEATVARALGVEPVRLYQWKTHRRRMPTTAVTNLAILAGRDVVLAVGRYGSEWELIKNHPELSGSR